MAGDWLKMTKGLDGCPEVIELAELLELPRDHVVGILFRFWSWADTHLQKGDAPSVTKKYVDELSGVTGFGNALKKVGWLVSNGRGFSIPGYQKHMGQNAKQRVLAAERNQKYRRRLRDDPSVTKPSLEKRRGGSVAKATSPPASARAQSGAATAEKETQEEELPPIDGHLPGEAWTTPDGTKLEYSRTARAVMQWVPSTDENEGYWAYAEI
jgi:hypothetical protein